MHYVVGPRKFAIEEIVAVAEGKATVSLWDDPAFLEHLRRGAALLKTKWAEGSYVYGVNSGYGDSGKIRIPETLIEELPAQLVRFHGCGMGEHLPEPAARAVVLCRLVSLARGFSGVRPELLAGLTELLRHRITPRIPQEGSVGASGDLTPLSYVAAALLGERDVLYQDKVVPAAQALAEAGLEPLRLQPKEGLALMNGTSAMTALACFAFARAEYLLRLAARSTALVVEVLGGNPEHFNDRLFALKPFTGQQQVAEWISEDLSHRTHSYAPGMQDRYSLRCAPHVLGVLADSLPWIRQFIETELNSVNDNPVVLPNHEQIIHGGHFYGGHIAFAADSLKNAVANIADLLDRQVALLVDPATNNGLARNLSGATEERAAINHGFKAVQIAISSWTAEALKHCMPASVFSRSTECHNQDKVSLGTIAARDAIRVLELCEQVQAAHLAAAVQAFRLRERNGELLRHTLTPALQRFLEQCDEHLEFVEEDRSLEPELRSLLRQIRSQAFPLYDS